jgi:hypothetical protein
MKLAVVSLVLFGLISLPFAKADAKELTPEPTLVFGS